MATKGTVSGVIANMVTLVVDGPVAQNEICYISTGGDKLMAEVIKVVGSRVYVQVFESTRGLKVGAEAEFTGHMLEVTLGPGMLSKNYDGLQNDLDKMDGVFLKRGQYTYPLDKERVWHFVPLVNAGDKVQASAWLGQVDENFQPLKMMAPFTMKGTATVKTIMPEGDYKIEDTIAVLTDEEGNDIPVTMIQRWPVKRAMTNYKEKPRPFKLLETGVRVIDTLNPIVEGGTGFIPGPFGTGKTVLQHAISKQAEADIVIIAACGERANEVVEIFTEFPELVDPHTGRKLMERTIIIANTSNMPVAAREASVYTAMTLAEYYRSMGLKVLLMADSTSRWAQALREMSNRMEELPGPDAFPMDISAIISNFYGRAGYVKLNNDETGSITFIGTVSPAGGNLKEPVTENTKKVARCFYALEQDRADKKRYPAVNPIDSYSTKFTFRRDQGAGGDNIGTGGIIDVLRYRPTNGLREFGYIDPSYADPDEEALFTYTNPKSDIAINQQNKYAYNYTNAISLEWKPVKGLVLRTEATLSLNWKDQYRFWGALTGEGTKNNSLPVASIQKDQSFKYIWTNTASYGFSIKDKHNFSMLLGQEIYHSQNKKNFQKNRYFPRAFEAGQAWDNMGFGTPQESTSSLSTPDRTASFFGQASYNYNHKYLLSVTMRADGSTKFAPGNQWGYFPSVSGAWVLSEEKFMEDIKWIDQLKLRAAIGLAGNNRISDDMWRYLYTVNSTGGPGFGEATQFGEQWYGNQGGTTFANKNIKWETTLTRNLAADITLFNGRLTVTPEIYWNTTKDLLYKSDIPSATGYVSQMQNIGQVTNKGVELTISGDILSGRDYVLSANLSLGMLSRR